MINVFRGEADKKLGFPLHFYKSRGSSTMDGVKEIRLQADAYWNKVDDGSFNCFSCPSLLCDGFRIVAFPLICCQPQEISYQSVTALAVLNISSSQFSSPCKSQQVWLDGHVPRFTVYLIVCLLQFLIVLVYQKTPSFY